MSIPERFIQRPIATTLVMMAILLFGIASYRRLAGERSAKRRLSHHQRVRQRSRRESGHHGRGRGAAVGKTVFQYCRARFDGVLESSRAPPRSSLQFSLDRNLDGAAQDVQAAISQAARQLPPNMPSPPLTIAKTPPTIPYSSSLSPQTPCRFPPWTSMPRR